MQACKRLLFAAFVLTITARFAAAGELPTAKPKARYEPQGKMLKKSALGIR